MQMVIQMMLDAFPQHIIINHWFLSYEDKGIGFGAAASNVSWDDCYSPEIWLKPGVDNYLKFYSKI